MMKKMTSLLLTLVLLASCTLCVNATDAIPVVREELLSLEQAKTPVALFEGASSDEAEFYFISYDEDGKITGYNMPIPLAETRTAENTYLKSTRIDDGSKSNVYCGIHPDTDVWRRVSSYSFTRSRTVDVSVSVSYNGKSFGGSIGVSASTSTSFSFSITVDQNRDSKLQVYCDYDYVIYKGEIRDSYTNELYQTFQYAEFTKTAERFVPYYR